MNTWPNSLCPFSVDVYGATSPYPIVRNPCRTEAEAVKLADAAVWRADVEGLARTVLVETYRRRPASWPRGPWSVRT